MIKSISKKDVIKALKTENLKRGRFFRNPEQRDCAVCAVGAVLRHMSFETWTLSAANTRGISLWGLGEQACRGRCTSGQAMTSAQYKEMIAGGNYLGALSVYFEAGNTRKRCIEFVKRYFPETLTLEIN